MFKTLKRALTLFLVVAIFTAGIPFFGLGGLNPLFSGGLTANAETTHTTDNFVYTVSGSSAEVVGYSGTLPLVVTIPSELDGYTVTSIGDEAFGSKLTLLSVSIPSTVTSIGEKAFYNCTTLNTLVLGSGLKSIGELAFGNCNMLNSVTIPKSVTSIGDGAFADCSSLAAFSVESGSKYFSSTGSVLYNSTKTSILAYPAKRAGEAFTVPSSVISIGAYAFSEASNLATVTMQSKLLSVNAYAFAKSSVKTVDMSDCSALTTIGAYAFEDCTKLTSVDLSDTSVTAVGSGAFSGCTSVRTAVLSSKMTTLGDYLFDGCKSLARLSIPASLKTVGKAAFRACSSITEAALPNTVTSVGDSAFKDCTSLKTFGLGSGVKSLTGEVFQGCTSLTTISVADDEYFSSLDGILTNRAQTRIVCYPAGRTATTYTIPSSITRIGEYAFSSCSKLKTLSIPATVTAVDDNAVVGCSGLTINCTEDSAAEEYFSENTKGYGTLKVSGTSPTLVVSDAAGKAGEQVKITVSVKNNPGIIAAAFTVKYDATKVKFVSIASSGALTGFTYVSSPLLAQCKVSFTGDAASKNMKEDTTLVTITFELLSIFTSGTASVSVTADSSNIYDVDLKEIAMRTSSGKITLGTASSSVSGDVNGDGEVTAKDVTTLRRHVAGWSNITLDLNVADVNGDGDVTAKDVTIMGRYVAKWPNVKLA